MDEDPDPDPDGRLDSSTFTSALSVNEFAACTMLGLEPVQMVQGYAVLAQSSPLYSGWVSMTGQRFTPGRSSTGPYAYMNTLMRKMASQGYWKRYRCPHVNLPVAGDHVTWGSNAEQPWLHSAWKRGYSAAFTRMVAQAKRCGAHGIIGVRDDRRSFAESPALEYRVTGTAVRIAGAPDPIGAPWTTHLAGQPLVNLVAEGFMPVSAIVERTWMAVWPYCMTKFFLEGKILQRDLMGDPVQEVNQVSEAKMALLDIAAAHVRDAAHGDPVYGMDIELADEHHEGSGAWIMDATIRASQVRKFDNEGHGLDLEPMMTLS